MTGAPSGTCSVTIEPSAEQYFSSIARRLYRVFSHAYHHHRRVYDAFEVRAMPWPTCAQRVHVCLCNRIPLRCPARSEHARVALQSQTKLCSRFFHLVEAHKLMPASAFDMPRPE